MSSCIIFFDSGLSVTGTGSNCGFGENCLGSGLKVEEVQSEARMLFIRVQIIGYWFK